jgi:hypothetical protein
MKQMKEIKVRQYFREQDVPLEHIQYYEKAIKERLAHELAEKLVNEIQWQSDYNYFTMTTEIAASITIMDSETIRKFNQAMKLLKEAIQ